MDSVIKNYKIYDLDQDLAYCQGVAYQLDMSKSVTYDKDYFEKYVKMSGTEIAKQINASRKTITEKWCTGALLDIGIGSGEFISSSSLKVYGYDINLYGIDWLSQRGLFVNPYESIPEDVCGFTLWDTLEHIVNPHELFAKIKPGQYIFISIPVVKYIFDVKLSKHYRPNEHYYYFTIEGLIQWLKDYGFELLENNDDESKAGRDSIETFAFKRR